jgi:hypothetical protein
VRTHGLLEPVCTGPPLPGDVEEHPKGTSVG